MEHIHESRPPEASSTYLPAVPDSQWNIETSQNHLLALMQEADRRYLSMFDAMSKAVEIAFSAQQTSANEAISHRKEIVDSKFDAVREAVDKAQLSMEKRIEGLNEFRSQMADQQAKFIQKEQAESRFQAIDVRVSDLLSRSDTRYLEIMTRIDGQIKELANTFTIRLNDTTSRLDRAEGNKSGGKEFYGYLLGGIGMLIGVLGFLFSIYARTK